MPRFAGSDAGIRIPREAGDVHFVDHRIDERPLERRVAFPVVLRRIDDDALHGAGRVVARRGRLAAVVFLGVGHGERVRIDQQLLGIESQAGRRFRSARVTR